MIGAGRSMVRAEAAADGTGRRLRPAALVIEDGRLVAAGEPQAIGAPGGAAMLDLPGHVVLPALVNAHCHLDLSHLGTRPYQGDFARWIDMIRLGRCSGAGSIAASVRRGIELARAGGTALVGDIAGVAGGRPSLVAAQELRAAGLAGVSYLEVFGRGVKQDGALGALRRALGEAPRRASGVRLGVQPHAPYSCGPELYLGAARLGAPAATHLAETPEELEFCSRGTGTLAALMEAFGARVPGEAPEGRHPIDVVEPALRAAPFVAAHVNYAEERHMEVLARTRTTVAYCPRASAYFGHPLEGRPAHPWRTMLAAGVNVALGTDGLPCLDTPERISVLDEMRFLHRRDGADPGVLLRMATVAGATAMGFDPGLVSLRPGPIAGLLAVPADGASDRDPLVRVLAGAGAPRWIAGPFPLEAP